VVLVTVDTLRLDAFAGGPGREPEMPNARAWAERGLVFERAYSATSTTQPTHASILTGLHPWEHGVSNNGVLLSPSLPTVAEALSGSGWETAAVVASFPLDHRFGWSQGFDHFVDVFDRGQPTTWQGVKVAGKSFYALSPAVNEHAFALLDRLEADRQFLWVHYFDAHAPYGNSGKVDPPPPLPDHRPLTVDEQAALARYLYDSDVRTVDRALGRLRERLERDADRFETHVIVTADHGESFGEDGAVGHGFRVTDEQIRVPLFIVSPRVAPGRVEAPVGSIDVGATLIDLAGLGRTWGRGVSLVDLARPPEAVMGMRRRYAPGAMEPLADKTRRPLPQHRFYRVEGDRVVRGSSEGVDGVDSPDDAARFRDLFAGFERELAARDPRTLDDAETREALEALGYAE
jgi:arylsulfatase A-like enzyme